MELALNSNNNKKIYINLEDIEENDLNSIVIDESDTNENDIDEINYNNAGIIPINDATFYCTTPNFICDHNLNSNQSEELLKDLENGSWLLRNYIDQYKLAEDKYISIKLNAITIKLEEGFVHHKGFIFNLTNDKNDVIEVDKWRTFFSYEYEKKIHTFREYRRMPDFLAKLSYIYGLNVKRQVIYEND